MRIRVALLEQDVNYLTRIQYAFANKFPNELEVYIFTDLNVAMSNLKGSKINVFIASDHFKIDETELPKNCGLAYFVDSADIEYLREKRAICKFQKPESIYKIILEIFSDNVSESISFKKGHNTDVRVITFASANGGAGSSCAAVACAKSFAALGQKVLYLNLEVAGNTDIYFSGEGHSDFSDVIFALKSKRTSIGMRLTSSAKQDSSGVFFFSSPKVALDMMELKTEEIIRLIDDLKLVGSYNTIILDADFSFNMEVLDILKLSSAVVFVSDGTETANIKLTRVYNALEILDERSDSPLLPRLMLFYNKFGSKSVKASINGVREIGGAGRYEHATTEKVIAELVKLDVFMRILE